MYCGISVFAARGLPDKTGFFGRMCPFVRATVVGLGLPPPGAEGEAAKDAGKDGKKGKKDKKKKATGGSGDGGAGSAGFSDEGGTPAQQKEEQEAHEAARRLSPALLSRYYAGLKGAAAGVSRGATARTVQSESTEAAAAPEGESGGGALCDVCWDDGVNERLHSRLLLALVPHTGAALHPAPSHVLLEVCDDSNPEGVALASALLPLPPGALPASAAYNCNLGGYATAAHKDLGRATVRLAGGECAGEGPGACELELSLYVAAPVTPATVELGCHVARGPHWTGRLPAPSPPLPPTPDGRAAAGGRQLYPGGALGTVLAFRTEAGARHGKFPNSKPHGMAIVEWGDGQRDLCRFGTNDAEAARAAAAEGETLDYDLGFDAAMLAQFQAAADAEGVSPEAAADLLSAPGTGSWPLFELVHVPPPAMGRIVGKPPPVGAPGGGPPLGSKEAVAIAEKKRRGEEKKVLAAKAKAKQEAADLQELAQLKKGKNLEVIDLRESKRLATEAEEEQSAAGAAEARLRELQEKQAKAKEDGASGGKEGRAAAEALEAECRAEAAALEREAEKAGKEKQRRHDAAILLQGLNSIRKAKRAVSERRRMARRATRAQAVARGFLGRVRAAVLLERRDAAVLLQAVQRRRTARAFMANKRKQRSRWMKLHRPMAFARAAREAKEKRLATTALQKRLRAWIARKQFEVRRSGGVCVEVVRASGLKRALVIGLQKQFAQVRLVEMEQDPSDGRLFVPDGDAGAAAGDAGAGAGDGAAAAAGAGGGKQKKKKKCDTQTEAAEEVATGGEKSRADMSDGGVSVVWRRRHDNQLMLPFNDGAGGASGGAVRRMGLRVEVLAEGTFSASLVGRADLAVPMIGIGSAGAGAFHGRLQKLDLRPQGTLEVRTFMVSAGELKSKMVGSEGGHFSRNTMFLSRPSEKKPKPAAAAGAGTTPGGRRVSAMMQRRRTSAAARVSVAQAGAARRNSKMPRGLGSVDEGAAAMAAAAVAIVAAGGGAGAADAQASVKSAQASRVRENLRGIGHFLVEVHAVAGLENKSYFGAQSPFVVARLREDSGCVACCHPAVRWAVAVRRPGEGALCSFSTCAWPLPCHVTRTHAPGAFAEPAAPPAEQNMTTVRTGGQ
jgi:hypothetical protein